MKLAYALLTTSILVGSAGAATPRLRMPSGSGSSASTDSSDGAVSAVYSMSNLADNEVEVYSRDVDSGALTFLNRVSTTGVGSVGIGVNGLGSTNVMTVAGGCLLVANAGSNDVSTFAIDPSSGDIEFANKVPSGGAFPLSIAHRDGLVYVLNAAGQGHLQAFALVQFNCLLVPIGGPVETRQGGEVQPQDPSPPTPFAFGSPGQIGFTPDGDILVTIKRNGGILNPVPFGSINVYELNADGTTSDDLLTQTILDQQGLSIPFSFAFSDENELLIGDFIRGAFDSEGGVLVFDGDAYEEQQQSLVTGFGVNNIVFNPQNQCAYTASTGIPAAGLIGNRISSLSAEEGSWAVVEEVAAEVNRPNDMAVSADGEYLYAISNMLNEDMTAYENPRLVIYEVGSDCSLEEVGDGSSTVFESFNGIAVYPNPN